MQELSYYQDLCDTGEAIRERREALNISQEQLAEMAQTSWNTVHRTENAKSGVRIDVLYRFCDALNITPYDCAPKRFKNDNDFYYVTRLLSQLTPENQEFVLNQMKYTIQHLLAIQNHQ